MARAHYLAPVTDNSGNRVSTAVIRVLQPGTTTPITDTMYTTRTGLGVRTQPWNPASGLIDFYLEVPQTVRLGVTISPNPEFFWNDVDVGAVRPWERTVKDYGAMGDGVTDDAGAIQEAIDDMAVGGTLSFTEGTYVVGTTIQLPNKDGCSLIAPVASQLRLPAAVLRAKTGSALQAIAATEEWLTNGVSGQDAQGLVIQGLGFDGGGFRAGTMHDTEIEVTAETEHGLVIHGNGWKLLHTFVLSANGHGIFVPQAGVDGTTIIGESHENTIFGGGVQYTGGDCLHAGPGNKDTWVEMFRPQYAGGHCIYTGDNCGAWSFVHCHPSWAAGDIMHLKSGWQVRVIGNYIGGLGVYMDGASITHRGIYVEGGPAIVTGNSINDFPPVAQVDPIVAISLKNGPVICKDNTFIYNASDDGTLLEQVGIGAPSIVTDNFFVTS